jgi:hypothetical protein
MITASHVLGLAASSMIGAGLFTLTMTAAPRPTIPFDEAILYVEYNASDEDAEVVVDVDADVGLARFSVLAPNGKEVLNLRSRDSQDLGIRKINLETPEPALEDVLEAYPEGWYRFYGKSVDGETLFSEVRLSHELPLAPRITYPLDGDVGVPTSGAAATWNSDSGSEGFFFELEQDDLEVDIKSNVAADATSFGFPDGWLEADTEYQMGLATRAENGNLTVVEIHFTTGS